MQKLSKEDVALLGEGAQVKRYLVQRYKTVREFYNSYNFSITYKSFCDYLCRDKIYSDSFKLALVTALDTDYNNIVMSKNEQLRRTIEAINKNIDLYRDESDQYIFDIVIENTKKHGSEKATAEMYKTKAKYYYNLYRINHVADCYHMAAETVKKTDMDAMLLYYLDLLIIYFRENMLDNAKDLMAIIDDYVKLYEKSLCHGVLTKYYYWKGVLIIEKDGTLCRKYLNKAFAYANTNIERAVTIQNIGLSYYNEKVYDLAIMKYQDACSLYDQDDVVRRSSIWNNIAMTNMAQGLLDKAMENVNKAIDMLNPQINYRFYMKYLHTLAKLHIVRGNEREAIKYFDVLEQHYDKELDKKILMCDIMEIINLTVMEENIRKIAEVLMRVIRMDISEWYRGDLLRCLGVIHMKLEKEV